MEDYRLPESRPERIARRLQLTRLGVQKPGDSQAAYARRAGLEPSAYNNYEKGSRIGLDAAISLCVHYNLTLDWIYFGDGASLPAETRDKIEVAKLPVEAPSKPRREEKRRPFRAASSRSALNQPLKTA